MFPAATEKDPNAYNEELGLCNSTADLLNL